MCIPEPQLLRLIAGELPDEQRMAAEAHLDTCPQCRALFEELQRTWDTVGQWQTPEAPSDLTARILAAAAQSPLSARIRWLRVAAAFLIASAVGISAGLAVPPRSAALARPVSAEEVVQQLGLDVLGSDTGLTDGFLHTTDSHPEEDSR